MKPQPAFHRVHLYSLPYEEAMQWTMEECTRKSEERHTADAPLKPLLHSKEQVVAAQEAEASQQGVCLRPSRAAQLLMRASFNVLEQKTGTMHIRYGQTGLVVTSGLRPSQQRAPSWVPARALTRSTRRAPPCRELPLCSCDSSAATSFSE